MPMGVILYSLFVNDRKVMYPATDSICFQQDMPWKQEWITPD
ncbi:hypothetical protein [Paenibacillus amylolyticus]|nr:hypothetical protein [Paenibacillus amylolyticus]